MDHTESWKKKINLDQILSLNIARQWFGHSLTPDRWDRLFLTEGFAGYLARMGNRRVMGKLADKVGEHLKIRKCSIDSSYFTAGTM